MLRPIVRPILRPLVRGVTEPGYGLLTVYGLLATWERPVSSTVYLWRHFGPVEQYEMRAPSDDAGHYTCARFLAGLVMTIGRLYEGMFGSAVHHSNGAVTKTGTWTNSSNAGIFGGSASWASAAGATIACTVNGSTLGLRVFRTSNGGYATVAIDGDYTAATDLPAVTQALIDASKFTQEQLGHRYISMYANTSNADLSDGHILLAENLPVDDYTITVRAAGSAQAETGNRAYISGFVGCTGSQTAADGPMFYTRDITNSGTTGVSAMTLAWTFKPSGGAGQWIGDNHGNESITSSQWAVDGESVTLAADAYESGAEVTFSRVVDMTHPDAVGSVATKTDSFSCRADRRYQIQYDWSVEWAQAGEIGPAYCGMLNKFQGIGAGTVPTKDKFGYAACGDAALLELTGATVGNQGNAMESVMAFFDDAHDTIGAMTVAAQSLADWQYAAPSYAFISDISTNAKLYFMRASTSNPEPITVAKTMAGSVGWRTARISNVHARLSALLA